MHICTKWYRNRSVSLWNRCWRSGQDLTKECLVK